MKTLEVKYPNKFHRTAEELKEFTKENNIKLLRLSEYLRKRNDKKIQKGTITKCQRQFLISRVEPEPGAKNIKKRDTG